MPEYFMRENKVHPDVIARALYTGGHDATLLAVANGKIDAGALDEAVFERMTSLRPWDRTVEPGKVDPAKVRVFWTTPPFFDYVWVARKGLDAKVTNAFQAAFLGLNPRDERQKKILEALSATKYWTASDRDYDKLRHAAIQAGLLK
jgi:phosphonate transport system substrate-binding protein